MTSPSQGATRKSLLIVAAFGLVVLGGTVCAGWIMRDPRIVQVQPGLVAMKFNTAILFIICGAAVAFWASGRRAISTAVATAGLVIAGLIVLQYPLGRSLGVDTLFHEPFLVRPGETPGRISPYTSGAFVALMVGIIASRWSPSRPWMFAVGVVLCALVQLLASTQLVGYATGHRLPLAGGTSMAVHTALGLLVASWAVLGLNWPPDGAWPRRGHLVFDALLLMPVAASLFGAGLAVWVLSVLPGNGETHAESPVWPGVTLGAVSAAITAAAIIAARGAHARAAALLDANQRLVLEISARERLESAQRLLVAELDHRVRNTLAQVLSLAESTARASPDVRAFNEVFGQRIRALSRAHSVLAESRWKDVDLGQFLRAVLEPFAGGDRPRVALSGDDVTIPARATTPLCMVCYELAANASRHGALSRSEGRVEVSWRRIIDGEVKVELVWQEIGGPRIAAEPREGFGVSLIRSMVPHELGGRTELTFPPEGARCVVSMPLTAAREAGEPMRRAG